MSRVTLLVWQPEDSNRGWIEVVTALERRLQSSARVQLRMVRWPHDGPVNLTFSEVIVAGYPVRSWFPKAVDGRWSEWLSKAGNLIGKTAYAFSGGGLLGRQRTLVLLMNSLEAEGMVVRDFEHLDRPDQVTAFVARMKHLEEHGV